MALTTQALPIVRSTRSPDAIVAAHWPAILLGIALVLGGAARVAFGHGMPLWFDETFTATIATQPTVAALLRWCLTELTGPAFYAPMWLWVKAFGAGDLALRTPSLILSFAAPIALTLWGHPDKRVRIFWASVALLWLPALPFANDARPYPQIFFLACVQAIAFLHLLRRPAMPTALAWTSVTALLILTHYSALPVSACQGLAYLFVHRQRAAKTWPALAPFVPVAVWMAYHLSFMLAMTNAPGSDAPSMTLAGLLDIPAFSFGVEGVGLLVLGVMLATLLLPRFRGHGGSWPATEDLALVAAGLAAFAAAMGVALIHMGFAPRYLMPIMPSLLFGVALWARWCIGVNGKPVIAAFAVLAAAVTSLLYASLTSEGADVRHLFSFEPASAWLMERPPERLIFLWTDNVGDLSLEHNIAEIAGFGFRRRGHPVAVSVVHRGPGQDTSRLARLAAGDDPSAAILWTANDRDRADHVIVRIADQDPRWTCRDFGGGKVLMTACRRR